MELPEALRKIPSYKFLGTGPDGPKHVEDLLQLTNKYENSVCGRL